MINVLHIHTLPVISGSGINTFLSMEGLNKSRYRPALACAPGGRLIPLVRSHHMEVVTFRHLVQSLSPIRDLSALLALTLFLKKRSYHIIHTHNSKAGFIGRLAGRLAGVPVIVHTVHGFAFHQEEPPWKRVLFRTLERLASHWCDRMIFISEPLIDWALKEKVTVPGKITKIYSGIEVEKFSPVSDGEKARLRGNWGLSRDDRVIGIVSKLWEGKGHEILIQAFDRVRLIIPRAKLVIVGEGYLHDTLTRLVDHYGLGDSVIFTGFRMDVPEIIATFDTAVLPSFFEGMGRVLLEAMAMEKPVVASRVGGIPDLVEDGRNGFLVRPGDVPGLAHALEKVLFDKELASRMGREGRRTIAKNFSSEAMVKSIESVYAELLHQKGFPSCD